VSVDYPSIGVCLAFGAAIGVALGGARGLALGASIGLLVGVIISIARTARSSSDTDGGKPL
jgi:hypothetical protein